VGVLLGPARGALGVPQRGRDLARGSIRGLDRVEQPALLALERADPLAALLDRAAQPLELAAPFGLAGGRRRKPGGERREQRATPE
jgi:hypothetical protein